MRSRALPTLIPFLIVAGCATGGKLLADADVAKADIEKARRSGAVKCAPRETALAESNIDFALLEISQGNATRAREHLDLAQANVKKALDLSKTCGPTQVTIRDRKQPPPPPPPPLERKKVVVIEKTDRDHDGVPDVDDKCPDLPGKPEFQGCPDRDGDGIPDADDACPLQPGPKETQGCPVSRDTDGDGTPDDIDRCPDNPEDKDGFQDEDGCPDSDNDNDGIVDRMDSCPNNPGPIENHGCPVVDRDGDGVPDDEDRCPDIPGKAEFKGCPDQDGDGIPDAEDKCPLNAGPKENQGCPDTDRDGDGIPDRLDKCADNFGMPPDGCPKKYSLVEVKKDRIEIKQQVHFASGKWLVLPDSQNLLNQVVAVLNDFPKMRISIEGHTDNVGTEASNMRLSQRRAEAVGAYLIQKGIAADRLESVGFGPTRPIASNKTVMGRSQNRRTEFRIVTLE
ncbi:MAG: OmpA family protein [Anaeromyxobacteraceae bacterium]